MKKSVKGGPAMDAAKLVIDAIFKGLDSCMKDLEDHGLEKKKEEDIEEDGVKGKYLMYSTGSDHIIELKLFGVESHPGKYMVRIQHDDGQDLLEVDDKLFSNDDISKFVLDYAEKYDLGALEEGIDVNDNVDMKNDDLFQSSKISVTLKKVTASDNSTDIHLCAINAGGNPVRAMKVLADVLDDDEFVDAITEEPVSFEITETASDYDVEEATGVDTSETFREMLRACVECYHNLQSIHWGAKTSKFRDIHSFVESLIWSIQYNVDTIAEWCVEYTKSVPNVLEFSYTPIQVADGFDFGSAMSAAKAQIDNYIAVLECYYVNVEHDVQSVMDNWIRDLKKQSNYVLDRSLITESCDCKEL